MTTLSNLQTLWFVLIGVLWAGYFFLEGFDFGVGILLPFLGRDDTDRRVLINSIGPVWDGNEVWLLVAGGATFAAFPNWYATLFSGFYLALFLILLALIVRGVAFEYRGKVDSAAWKAWFDRMIFAGSLVPALLWGVAFANFINGVPIDAHQEYTGNLFTLLNPFALVGGLMTLSLFTLHGGLFLVLKTEGDLQERVRRATSRLFWVALVVVVAFLAWAFAHAVARQDKGVVPDAVPLAAIAAVIAVGWLRRERRDIWAFLASGAGVVLVLVTMLLNLYPRVLISSTNPDFSLTIHNASSTAYTLTVMTVVALVFTPLVIAYQAWTYWIFRRRIRREDFGPLLPPPRPAGSGSAAIPE